MLATHDLEIRGAGEFLGEEQSGELTEVGLTMYLDMLEATVRALKAGEDPADARPLAAPTEVNLHVPALLPADYVSDVQTRLALYKRIAAAGDTPALDELQTEVGDRFGALPEAAQNLFHVARLTLRCRAIGIRRLDVGAQASHVVFEADNRIDPSVVIRLIQRDRDFRLEGSLKLRVARGALPAARHALASTLLGQLSPGTDRVMTAAVMTAPGCLPRMAHMKSLPGMARQLLTGLLLAVARPPPRRSSRLLSTPSRSSCSAPAAKPAHCPTTAPPPW